MVTISELYGKKIMSATGNWIGEVGEVVIDIETGAVSHLLLGKIDTTKDKSMVKALFKNSVEFKRVKKITETILVSGN